MGDGWGSSPTTSSLCPPGTVWVQARYSRRSVASNRQPGPMGSYEPRRAAEMAWTAAAVEGHPPSSCPSWNTPRSSVNTGHFEPSHGATAIEDVLASIESTRPPEGRLCSALLQASRDVGTRVVPANQVDLRVRLHPDSESLLVLLRDQALLGERLTRCWRTSTIGSSGLSLPASNLVSPEVTRSPACVGTVPLI